MDRQTIKLCMICSASTFVGAIALPRLWGLSIGRVVLPTGSWILILILFGSVCFLAGSLLWVSIPNRVRQTLDLFLLQMGVRIESIEGQLGDQLNSLRILIEQHLVKVDEESISSNDSVMAEFAIYAMSKSILETHRSAGECYLCKGKHPKAGELAPGDPALYSYEAHGKLEDGKPCPIPYLYKLACDRKRVQTRAGGQ